MNQIGIKFLLQGHFFQTVMGKHEAESIIQQWANRSFKDQEFIGGTNTYGTWCIKTADIIGIHTFEFQPETPEWLGRSGIK